MTWKAEDDDEDDRLVYSLNTGAKVPSVARAEDRV